MSNSLYHFDSNVKTDVNRPTYIEAGIKENIFLKSVEYKTTDKGNELISFNFENAAGDKLFHTEWPTKSVLPFEQLTDKEREELLKRVENQKERIKQIVKTYLPSETFDMNPETFKEFAEIIIGLLKGKTENVPVRVKIVYNNKGFTTLPSYSKYKFIEPMTVSAEASKIKQYRIDVFTRPTPNVKSKDNVLKAETAEVGMTEGVKSNDDLPF